jgi:hypothetical protein
MDETISIGWTLETCLQLGYMSCEAGLVFWMIEGIRGCRLSCFEERRIRLLYSTWSHLYRIDGTWLGISVPWTGWVYELNRRTPPNSLTASALYRKLIHRPLGPSATCTGQLNAYYPDYPKSAKARSLQRSRQNVLSAPSGLGSEARSALERTPVLSLVFQFCTPT